MLNNECYNQLQKCWDTPKKWPFLLQIAPGHRSVRYNNGITPPSHSKLFLQFWVWSCIASNFDKGWRGNHKHKIMDRPFMPKYGTVTQVLLQLVVAIIANTNITTNNDRRSNKSLHYVFEYKLVRPTKEFRENLFSLVRRKYLKK